jgi:Rha family phage regulatory protein
MTTAVQAVDFTSFVFAQGDDIKTTSLLVAAKFGKRHDDVLRKIRNLDCSKDFTLRNFTECFRINELANNKQEPFYEMTKDGFMFLVMGFTGKAAAQIKETYINAFNFMLEKLTPKYNNTSITYLTPAMKKHINRQVAFLAKTQVGTDYKVLGKSIQDKFNVNKRELIPASKYREVCAFLGCEPDPKALQGELLEPVKVEYQPPAGMVLIAVDELESLRHEKEFDYVRFIKMVDKCESAGYVMANRAKIGAALAFINEALKHYI